MKRIPFLLEILIAGILLFGNTSLQAQSYSEGADLSNSIITALTFTDTAGTYTYSGTVTTPSDYQDDFYVTIPTGFQITNVTYQLTGAGGFNGFMEFNYVDVLTGGGNGNGTFPLSYPVGPGTYDVINAANFSAGNQWTVVVTVAAIPAPTPPANDSVCHAIALSAGVNGPYDNTNATVQSGEVSPPVGTTTADCYSQTEWCYGSPSHTLWFTWVASASGHDTILSPGFDTQLALWDISTCGSFTAWTLMAADDDQGETHGGATASSWLDAKCLIPGHTYYLQLSGNSGATGSTTINAGSVANQPPTISGCPSNIDNGCNTTATWTAPTATDPEGCTVTLVPDHAPGSTFATGTTTVTYTATDQAGATATCSFTVTVTLPSSINNPFICYGYSYTVGAHTYTATNTYIDTLIGASVNGCDSIVTTNLTVRPLDSMSQTVTLCKGQSLIVGSSIHNTSGTYIDTLVAFDAHGCDSIITTNLTIMTVDTVSQSVTLCAGQSLTVGSVVHTATGTYTDTLTAADMHGCDSIVTTNLTIRTIDTFSQTFTLCAGQTVTVGAVIHNATGVYTDTLATADMHGCDSIVTTNLTVRPIDTFSQTFTLCAGHSLTVGSVIHNATGVYTDTLAAADMHGCDSIVTTNLTVRPIDTFSQTFTLCAGHSVTVGSIVHNATGVFIDTLAAADINGCDSIVTTTLTINPLAFDTITSSVCPGSGYTLGTQTYTTSGTFTDTISGGSVLGCDSFTTLHLIVYPAATDTITTTICGSDSFTVGTHVYYSTGTFTDTLSGAAMHGCDSIVTLHLTVSTAVTPAVSVATGHSHTICAGTKITFTPTPAHGGTNPTYQWYVSGNPVSTATIFVDSTLNNNDSVWVVMVSNASCASVDTVSSNVIHYTVNPFVSTSVTISANTSDTVCQNTVVNLYAVGVNGGTNPDFQWKRNGTNVGNSATYIANPILNGDVFTCVMTSTAACPSQLKDTSNAITFTINAYPTVAITSSSSTVCSGDSLLLTATGGSSYVWSNGSTTSSIYTTGGSYTVTATNNYGCTAGSAPIAITPHTIGTDSVTQMGDTLISGPSQFYQWYYNDSIISGAISGTYIATHTGAYQVSGIDSAGCKTTSNIIYIVESGINTLASDIMVRIYPNPNTGTFTLEFGDGLARTVTISDALGRVIINNDTVIRRQQYDLASIADGIYYLQVTDGRNSRTLKFTVTK